MMFGLNESYFMMMMMMMMIMHLCSTRFMWILKCALQYSTGDFIKLFLSANSDPAVYNL